MIVVTGSSGLLGRHVAAALLEAGHEVVGVDTAPPATQLSGHITADLTQLEDALRALKGARAVIHAAAIPRPTGQPASLVFGVNVTATFNVVEAAIANGVRDLVYASSFSVLGWPFNPAPVEPEYFPIDEHHRTAPQDAYALSKWLGEETIAAAVRRGVLGAVSLRLPWIQTPESFGRDILPYRDDAAWSASNLWSYIDARDAGTAFVQALAYRTEKHVRLFVSAADTFMQAETEDLLRRTFPGVELRRALAGTQSVIDNRPAREAIGFQPRHSWRDYV